MFDKVLAQIDLPQDIGLNRRQTLPQ